jgi:hypothetical protein
MPSSHRIAAWSSPVRAAAACVLAVGSVCVAGPTFEEVPDAGSTPATAQPATRTGPVGRITGTLTGTADGADDFEDMFLICIADPAGFSATVDPVATTFNTQLWLFELDGFGLLANDNDAGTFPTIFSKITPLATDGSGAAVTSPGLYFLAITTKNTEPASAGGPIFNDATFANIEVTGPDGPGGGQPFANWIVKGGAVGGSYAINLTGVKGFEQSCAIVCPAGATIDADAFDCTPGGADPNGGCSVPGVPTQNLGTIAPGTYEAVCGTTGVLSSGGSPVDKDRDWYRFTVATPGYLHVSIASKTPGGGPAPNLKVTLVRGTNCGSIEVLAEAIGPGCPIGFGPIPVSNGLHALVVTLDGTLPASPPCPTQYVLFVDERPTEVPACGVVGLLACDVPHAAPACNDPACCDLVCIADPVCCAVAWDASCVQQVFALCDGYPCPGDIDGNGIVGGADLAILLGAWGARGPADLDDSGTVNGADLAILLGAWGPCGG